MSKVYVVTDGEYSDYGIVKIFNSLEAAEKYCALHSNEYYDGFNIEEWELEDGSNITTEVHRSLFFNITEGGSLLGWSMNYDIRPFSRDIEERTSRNIGVYIVGYIPVDHQITTKEEAEKIALDELAKWKAERAGL